MAPTTVPRPAPSVRVPNETLDRFLSSVGEMMLTTTRLRTAAAEHAAPGAGMAGGLDEMDRAVGELKRRALDLRTTPLARIMENLPRIGRDVAYARGKSIEVTVEGAELELDRSILDRLYDPLVHVVRNAVDHGVEEPSVRRAAGKPEVGRVHVGAVREGDSIRISVADDGAGIDLEAVRAKAVAAGWIHPGLADDLPADELVEFVFRPGLSTASQVSEISGRGVGMDAVRATIEALGGTVRLRTEPGVGTSTTLWVPIAAAVQRVLLVEATGQMLALPIGKVERILEVRAAEVEESGGEAFVVVDELPTLVLDLARSVGWSQGQARRGPDQSVPLLLTEVRGERVALRVDALGGQHELYVKPLPSMVAALPLLSGLTVLGDGRPVFLLDVNQLR